MPMKRLLVLVMLVLFPRISHSSPRLVTAVM
jgi:hypothetical protein